MEADLPPSRPLTEVAQRTTDLVHIAVHGFAVADQFTRQRFRSD
jgi:hypothetical protein